ncbi:MAG: hypothetical protein R2822_30725 [Spirosomataceae bacterium]
MNSQRMIRVIIIVVLSFVAYYLLFTKFKLIKVELDKITHHGLTSYIATYFIIGIPIFAGTYFIDKKTEVFKSLGISKHIWTGLWISLLFAIPMFIGGLLFFKFNQQIDIENLMAGTMVAGFMEELYFRGFLFGQIFRNTRLGFIPSYIFVH